MPRRWHWCPTLILVSWLCRTCTKPTRASKQRRLEGKQQRGQVKRSRGNVRDFD